jgi:hypothetical protein
MESWRLQSRPTVPGYHLGDLIARGSAATVWAAGRAPGVDDLAVKVVPVPPGADQDDLAFELSALSMARGAGEHLVRVLDVVPVVDPGPAVAVVMERLRHGTLTSLVRSRGHLLPGEVVTLLTPVATTLAVLHDSAVVHGDLSPSNVGLDSRGRPMILDLGVAAVIGTPRDEVYGTPGFVAPEVVAGGHPSTAADVYAVGALGWFALTGDAPPVPAERPALDQAAPITPGALAQVLEQALHPDPARRPAARELGAMLYAAADPTPVLPGPQDDPATMLTQRVRDLARAAAREQAGSSSRTRTERRAALRRRSRTANMRVVAALAAMVLLGGAGVAVASAQRGTSGPPSAPSAPGAQTLPTAVTAGTGSAGSSTDPLGRYAQIIVPLVDARARAWNDADPEALARCFAPGSAALQQDRDVLSTALEQGHRYEGLTFAVDGIRAVSETEDRLSLEVTLTTGPYVVRTDGTDEPRTATSSRVRLVLIALASRADSPVGSPSESAAASAPSDSTGSAWRIAQVEEVDA